MIKEAKDPFSDYDTSHSLELQEIKKQGMNNLDVRVSNSYFNKLAIAEFSSAFFSLVGLFLSILLYERRHIESLKEVQVRRDEAEYELYKSMTQFFSMSCTFLLIFSLFTRYSLWLDWCKSVNKFTQFDTLITTGMWQSMVFEMTINLIAPYSFFDGLKYVEQVTAYEVEIEYEINDILLFFCFARVYIAYRFSFFLTEFMNPRTQRVCAMNGCHADAMFALKSLMKSRPFTVLLSSLFISLFIFSYLLRLFESPLSEASGQDFTSYNNAMWNMVITLTSAGYGDFYPKTFWGRVVGVSICFWGVIITSLVVATVTNMLTFTTSEEKSYEMLVRIGKKQEMKKKAVDVL